MKERKSWKRMREREREINKIKKGRIDSIRKEKKRYINWLWKTYYIRKSVHK